MSLVDTAHFIERCAALLYPECRWVMGCPGDVAGVLMGPSHEAPPRKDAWRGIALEGEMSLETIAAVLSIVIIDLTISGDNALVIGMAAHRLDPRQRRMAILFGAGGAVVLRIGFTVVAAMLLSIPLLQAAGGLMLAGIAFKLLSQECEDTGSHKQACSLFDAVKVIILADVAMSLDNVLGVAGASHGNLTLLMFGLVLSMSIVMFGSSLVADLMNRFSWLINVGALVLVWTSAQMIAEDRMVGSFLPHHWSTTVGLALLIGIIVAGATVGLRRARVARGVIVRA